MTTLSLPFPLPRRGGDGAALVPGVVEGWLRPGVPMAPPTATPAPADGPCFREIYKQPPDLRLESGGFCRFCDQTLQLFAHGWFCDGPRCGAAWTFTGVNGWWLPGGGRTR